MANHTTFKIANLPHQEVIIDIVGIHAFFYKQWYFSAQPQCCLTLRQNFKMIPAPTPVNYIVKIIFKTSAVLLCS